MTALRSHVAGAAARRNPVLDTDFPDPSVLAEPVDGWWFAYATQHTTIERWCHVLVARSRDLRSWELPRGALERPDVLAPDATRPHERLVEGPFVAARDGAYHLLYSGDVFGGDAATYAVLASRGPSPTGPFERLADVRPDRGPSSAILESSDRWRAPGHCSIATDADGTDWLAYHAIDVDDPWQRGERLVRHKFCLDRLDWVDGWPAVDGGRPSD